MTNTSPWITDRVPDKDMREIPILVQHIEFGELRSVSLDGAYLAGEWKHCQQDGDCIEHVPLYKGDKVVAWVDTDTIPEWAEKDLPAL